MKSNKLIGCLFLLSLLSACGGRTIDYDATGTFEATEVLVSAEASGGFCALMLKKVHGWHPVKKWD